jgi:hypothetical protein
MANNYKLWISYRFDDFNKYDIYNIPEYIKLIVDDDGIYDCQKNLYVAINIESGESITFTHGYQDKAKEFISERESEYHLLKCNITDYIGGHNKIDPEIIRKYEGTELDSPDRNCDMIEMTISTELDINIGDKVFISAYTPEYQAEYYKATRSRLPKFQVSKDRTFFTTRPDVYDLRCLVELVVN